MAKKKYCPMGKPLGEYLCIKELCAWWNKDLEECLISRIARELTEIASHLDRTWVGSAK